METTSTEHMLGEAWAVSPAVALRPEPFGAMAYHFGNRKLTFLKKPELVKVVQSLEESATVRDALVQAGVPERQWGTYLTALRSLAATDMIRVREGN
ncbi:mycofactocin biosynthesis chaperone MftB [Arthrobacter sp. FW305-BF8]|uniref:mycofactocin biosynthesis chaperone MftB n=1 Tax=Arthrobacter sp. FW305-BF8 TaxID=2879617 RepID=UPI001EEF12A2|nr:mycofactocin biosynthesis chaperone MftB [Arthrobacter sp. FW305-BF8]UKA55224.1 mycofactocin biosynthesis chaperone MftB [Arthrobacter sp. FW305-BF8]